MTGIGVVAWVGLNDHHLWNIAGDYIARFGYRTRYDYGDEFRNAVRWSGAIARVTAPCATTVRRVRAGGVRETLKARWSRPAT